MPKAVVFSVKGGVAMVLEKGGRFRKVPAKDDWQKGDVVRLPRAGPPRHRRLLSYYVNAAAGLLLIASLVGYAIFHYVGKTVTYVSIDINPSIELSLNNFDKVIAATSFGAEGQDALEETDLTGMSVLDALAALMHTRALEPFLDGNKIMVTISSDTSRPELESSLLGKIRELDIAGKWSDFVFSGAGWADTAQARELGVSLGKLTLAKQAQAYAPDIPIEELVRLQTQDLMDMMEED